MPIFVAGRLTSHEPCDDTKTDTFTHSSLFNQTSHVLEQGLSFHSRGLDLVTMVWVLISTKLFIRNNFSWETEKDFNYYIFILFETDIFILLNLITWLNEIW